MFLSGMMYKKQYIEFYENPSKKEINESGNEPLKNNIRFLADANTKNLWVWNSFMLHVDAHRVIGDGRKSTHPGLFAGIAEKIAGEWLLIEAVSFKNKNPRDWVWLNKYFRSVTPQPYQFVCNI